jgi:hypothetical protein
VFIGKIFPVWVIFTKKNLANLARKSYHEESERQKTVIVVDSRADATWSRFYETVSAE